ncbi:MAG: ribonuclease HI family protein [Thermoplasmata archaeon]|nr:ribonuclease HI family protein [Thermoplasmata archaeon]
MSDPEAAVPRGTALYPGVVQVHFDGACEPPRGGGIATYGFTVEGEGLDFEERGLAVRPGVPHATNNVAEYTGAIRALEWLRAQQYAGAVIVYGDSQLVIRQMTGEYAVRTAHLEAYHEHLLTLARSFSEVRFAWIPRRENGRADELTKLAIAEAREEAAGPTAREEPGPRDTFEPGRPGKPPSPP